jgi:formate hydrogenlyase subunit 3/multisubunit Na+/H+ antiporter MnhD subunit
MLLLVLSLILATGGILLLPFLPYRYRAGVSFIFVLLVSIVTSVPAVSVLTGSAWKFVVRGNVVFGNVLLSMDHLSAWFLLIINFTCINGALYGIGYMKDHREQTANLTLHWMLFLLFHCSMLWVCLLQNGLVFLVVWELMSLSSFLLVIFDHQNKRVLKAGINYLVQMHIGVCFLTVAFIWVYVSEGSFAFSAIEDFFRSHSNKWLFLLFFIGFGIKAGFIPLHSWLPKAHPAAPAHISGVMSGVIVKLGIYGILRIVFLLKQDYLQIGETLLILSVVTALYGILNAAVHRDFKRMLAYCTIENMGIIGMGIGLGLIGIGSKHPSLVILGFGGALLHTLNHSLFKSLLFFSAGSVYQQTHTRDMEKLGGLIHKMPQTAVLYLVGALAIAGLPPFNGFVSEFILYSGLLDGMKTSGIPVTMLMICSVAALALIGGISILAFTKNFGTVFLGNPRTRLHREPHEVTADMRIPQCGIIAVMLSVGLLPGFYFSVVRKIVEKSIPALLVQNTTDLASMINGIAGIGQFFLLFVVLSLAVYRIKKYVTRNSETRLEDTWVCAYSPVSPRLQYTGKSFSKSIGKLFDFIVIENKKYKEIPANEIFPRTRKHSSHYIDFFETLLINPVVERIIYSMNYFRFIQNGKIQMYVLYGILFITLIFLGTVFNFI